MLQLCFSLLPHAFNLRAFVYCSLENYYRFSQAGKAASSEVIAIQLLKSFCMPWTGWYLPGRRVLVTGIWEPRPLELDLASLGGIG